MSRPISPGPASARAPLRFLRGVGPQRAGALARLGLATVEDLLYVLPFRYEDRRRFRRVCELVPGAGESALEVEVLRARTVPTRRRGLDVFEAIVADATGRLRVRWFNQAYLARVFLPGRRVVLFGRPVEDRYRGDLVLEHPDYEFLDEPDAEGIHTGRIVPVYRKLGELTSRRVRTLMYQALRLAEAEGLASYVPTATLQRQGLLDRLAALRELHFPGEGADLEALAAGTTPAHRTLAFEEAFLLQLAFIAYRRGLEARGRGTAYEVTDALRTKLARLLPFKLTEAQKRVLREIGADLRAPRPMTRLLQGDVGSGKTIVALLTLLVAVENGYQGALMAPTEILAEQHYRNIARLFEDKGADYRVALLTGGVRGAARERILRELARGQIQLLIGTHALFERGVEFRRLGLVVVDEQHRFGVLQREALVRKGAHPDLLVMTATPIPRSLALTLYGDLDVSVIDALPPGRQPVETRVYSEPERGLVYARVREALAAGRQAYVVVPLVEETEKSDLRAATTLARELQREVFPDVPVGLLHGRMPGEAKERVMRGFVQGRIPILVSTTVVEVGVDVPNATVMVVEHADRFGLSQLHQLRGRVGRGAARSFCALVMSEEASPQARERLELLARTHDGFEIAEKDLEVRGPGMIFGTQQHGLSDLRFLRELIRDPQLIEAARQEARALVAPPQGLERARAILQGLRPAWRRRLGLGRIG